MDTVGELLKNKGNDLWTIEPQATVYQVLELMADKDVGSVLVVENDKLLGIFTERDYARKLILKGKISKDTVVNELMTKELLIVGPKSTIEDCMSIMTTEKIRHLPVMENEKLIGIITIGDLVKKIIADQENTIKQYEKYIGG